MKVEVILRNEDVPKCIMEMPDNWDYEGSTKMEDFLDGLLGSGNWTGLDIPHELGDVEDDLSRKD